MDPIPHETWRSLLRSPPRRRLLLLVNSLGEAYLAQLARMMGIRPSRVLALLYGDPPSYAKELALVPLGLVEETPTIGRGRAWRISALGRRKARSVSSAYARRAAARAAGDERWATRTGVVPPARREESR